MAERESRPRGRPSKKALEAQEAGFSPLGRKRSRYGLVLGLCPRFAVHPLLTPHLSLGPLAFASNANPCACPVARKRVRYPG
jgi:hypothetical protein